jgi:hypothetical protein
MPKSSVLQEFNKQLHINHKQIFTYSNCSFKFKFKNVENRPLERMSVNLPFGSAIHKAIDQYEIVAVEMPLSSTLYTEEGLPTDY